MQTIRLAMPACAALAMALAGCSGTNREDDAASNAARTETGRADDAMRNASDGSAAEAVGNMMNDPAIRDQLGMAGAAAPVSAPTRTAGMEEQLQATGADTGQAQALAACRALRSARTGMPSRPDATAVAQAARDLAADPNALGSCQAAM